MAYDELLAERVRRAVSTKRGVTEKKMFGGVAFLLKGRMFCGIAADDLMVRVGPDAYAKALSAPHARPMDFTGRPLTGYVFVDPRGVRTDAALRSWVELAVKFASNLTKSSSGKRRQAP
ncbi:MAG: TfoX/Sxy family protein [Gemmatimonadota bacterium]